MVCAKRVMPANISADYDLATEGPSGSDSSDLTQNKESIVAPHTMISFESIPDAGTTLHRMKGNMNDLPVEIPGLLNALDEIAKIHFSISGALPSISVHGEIVQTIL